MPVGGTAIARRSSARASCSRAIRRRRTTCASSCSSPTARISRAIRSASRSKRAPRRGTAHRRRADRRPRARADPRRRTPTARSQGIRRDEDGKPLTTELSADGEAQLAEIAKATGGAIVRAEHGETGIDEVARGSQEDDARGARRARRDRVRRGVHVAARRRGAPARDRGPHPRGAAAASSRPACSRCPRGPGRIRPERREKPSKLDKRERVDIARRAATARRGGSEA